MLITIKPRCWGLYKCRESTVDTHDTIGLFDTVNDTFDVEWFCASDVDDLSIHIVFFLQLLSDLKASSDVDGMGDKSKIFARALNFGFSNWENKVLGLCFGR